MTRSPLVAWLMWWVLLAILYLLLAAKLTGEELVMSAVAATIGATGAVLVRRQRQVLLRPRVRWLKAAWRPVIGIVTDVVQLVRALVARGEPGGYVELPLEHTGEDGIDTAYRALSAAFGSLAPNTLIVDVDRERGVMVAHQLRRAPVRPPLSR